jgi:site-specific DNA recombinase
MPIVAMHPAIADNYRKQIASLDSTLISPDASSEAIPAVRSLIDRLVPTPNPLGRGVQIQVEGRLNAIVALATGAETPPLTATVERVKGIEPSS